MERRLRPSRRSTRSRPAASAVRRYAAEWRERPPDVDTAIDDVIREDLHADGAIRLTDPASSIMIICALTPRGIGKGALAPRLGYEPRFAWR